MSWFKSNAKQDIAQDKYAASSSQTRTIKELEHKKKSKVPLICLLMFAATIGIIMVLNLYVYNVQYEVIQLTDKKNDFDLQTQQLNESIQKNQAPQNLAKQAQSMGMVMSQDPAYINTTTGDITSIPSPKPQATVDYGALNGIPQVGIDGSADTSAQASQSAKDFNATNLNGGTILPPQQKDPTPASASAAPTEQAQPQPPAEQPAANSGGE